MEMISQLVEDLNPDKGTKSQEEVSGTLGSSRGVV